MPYAGVSEVPKYVPKAKRKQWMAVWNDSYSRHHDEGRAFAEASAAIKKAMCILLEKTSDVPYPDTGEYDESAEAELREQLVLWADYAEFGPTYDPSGKYLCGTCIMRMGDDDCSRVVSPISFTTGSCRIYVRGKQESSQEMPVKLTQIEAAYTERPNVKGFGCVRCEFGAEAKDSDSEGRISWCGFWGLHVEPKACCFKNTGDDDVFAPKGDATKTMHVTKTRDVNELGIFCPLVKVDEAKREVWGVVTAEEIDKSDEICDYETTVPYYKELVAEMTKATDGANIFPLRAMHGLVAAGKGIAIEFRDEAKQIYMGFKVVDDAEWKKVQENVYTGFSQGGRYVKRWKDGEVMRYTAKPGEVSLVDLPCLTRAHFDYVKADGSVEMRKFAKLGDKEGELNSSPTPVPSADVDPICTCDCTKCKAGVCKDCTKGAHDAGKSMKYLVTDSNGKGHLPYTNADGAVNYRLMGAAWFALFNKGDRRGNIYQGPNKERAKKKLKQLYAREGIDTPSEKAEVIDGLLKSWLEDAIQRRAYGQLGKGMYQVGNFARLLEDIRYLWLSLEYEREIEGDESPVTDSVREAYMELLDHLLEYTEEQVKEEQEREYVTSR